MSDDSSDSDFDEDPDEIGVPGGGKDLATVRSIVTGAHKETKPLNQVVPQNVSAYRQHPQQQITVPLKYHQQRMPSAGLPALPHFGIPQHSQHQQQQQQQFINRPYANNLVMQPRFTAGQPLELSDKAVSSMWMNADPKQIMITEEEEDDEEMGVAETYATYKPSKLKIGRPHPDTVVETASLSSVEPVDVKYKLSIPDDTIRSGKLSALQLESITYASQQHEHLLPDGTRAGFFIGDGAGVGKGRTIAGIIYENYLRGRKKAIWISVSNDLKYDAERDLKDIGASKIKVHALNKFKYGKLSSSANNNVKKGVIFSTYSALIGETGQTTVGKCTSRLKQLVQWCGEDFDGLIIFDECHRAKNLCPSVSSKPSKTGLTVLELQNRLPKARVVYASATGASEPKNMAYMVRLGMWGKGTPFVDFNEFISAVERRGVGAMEIVAMDMKLRGMYIARQLGFQGVTFKIEEVPISSEFKKTYDQSVQLWVEAMIKFQEATDLFQAESRMRKTMWSQFWSSHQRFFKYLCIAAKVKHTVSLAREALKCGKCVVIGLQSTGEARTTEQVERDEGELTDFLSTAKGVFQSLVDKHFPAPNQDRIHQILGLPLSQPGSWAEPAKRKLVQPTYQPPQKKVCNLELSDSEPEQENGKHDSDSDAKLADSESEEDAQSDEENSDVNSDYNPFDSDSDSDVDPWDRRKKKEKAPKKKLKKKPKTDSTSTQDTIQAMLMKKSTPTSATTTTTAMQLTAMKTTVTQQPTTLKTTVTQQSTALKTTNNYSGKNNGFASSSSSLSTSSYTNSTASNVSNKEPAFDQNSSVNARERACKMKEELLAKIEILGARLPPNTLDQLIDELGGTENVAEMTGRKKRVVSTEEGIKWESRSEVDAPQETLNLIEKQRFMDGEKTVAIISEAASSGISLQSDRRARNQMRRVHITLELPWSADRAIQQFGRTHRSNQVNAPEYVFLISNLAGERRFASTVSKRLESLGALTHGDRRATETRDLSQFNIDNKYGRAALEATMRAIMGYETPLVPPPKDYKGNFFKDISNALVGVGMICRENGGSLSLDKDYNNITKFLNRILGITVDLQNHLFQYFTDTLNAVITQAKRAGRFDMGILDLGASGETVRRVKLIRFLRKHATGIAPTELHVVQVERGMDWDTAEDRWSETSDPFEGFYLSHQVRNGKRSVLLAVCGSEIRKNESKRDQLFILYRPNTGLQLRQETLNELEKKYKKVSMEEARPQWIQQYQASLNTCSHAYWRGSCKNVAMGLECEVGLRRRSYNVLSGSVLSVWSRVESILASRLGSNSKMQVVRLRTEEERTGNSVKIVGTLIPKSCMEALKNVLQTDAEKVEEQNF